MKINIRGVLYEVVKDFGDTVKEINFDEIVTDYIVGDWAYNKVRLKGFYNSNHKYRKEHNDIKNVDKYIKNNCAYGCKHFILKKIEIEKEK